MAPVVLITGCSSGFGMLSAIRLAKAGHRVYATMRDLKKRHDLDRLLKEAKLTAHILQLDVTDETSIAEVIATIAEMEGQLNCLVNNAGFGLGGFFEDLDSNEIRDVMETNLFGVMNVTRAALPLMRTTKLHGGGPCRIVNISSMQGLSAMPGFSAYSTSKYALEGFSQSLYHEMQLLGIEIVLIEPGGYSTKIFNENRRIAAKSGHKNSPYTKYVTTLVNKLDKRLAQGIGVGNPEDVARLIEKVCTKRHVRLRYIIGSGTRIRLLLEMILPARIYSTILRRLMFG